MRSRLRGRCAQAVTHRDRKCAAFVTVRQCGEWQATDPVHAGQLAQAILRTAPRLRTVRREGWPKRETQTLDTYQLG